MKKYISKILFSILLIFILRGTSYSQIVEPEYNYAVIVSTPATYDFKYNRYEQGLSIHGVFAILNGTLEYRSFFKGSSTSLASFIGIGVGHLYSLQYGFQGSIRIRFDISVFNKEAPMFTEWTKVGYPRSGLALTFIFENQVRYKTFPWLLGMGIGFYF